MAKLKYLNFEGLKYLFKRGLRFTWQGTKDEWDQLSDDEKSMYDNAFIEDDGGDMPADPQPKIWTGTQDEWDQLQDSEKDLYDIAFVEEQN